MRPRRGLVAVVVAVGLLLGACGGSGGDVASDRGGGREQDRAGDDDPSSVRDRGDEDDRDDEVAAVATTSSSSTTTAIASTTVPAPMAAPATAPPPPPPTTVAPPPPTTAAPPPRSGPQHGARNTGCEQYMYSQINAARADVGQAALSFDTVIQHIAVDWSDEMAGSQTLRHNPSYGDQILRHRNYRTAGENVGRGYEQGSLFQAFMNSPGHRANIESGAYSHVTVGCLTDAGGQLWVTQNYWGG